MADNSAFGLPKQIEETPGDPFPDAEVLGAEAEPESPAAEAAPVEAPVEPEPGADPLAPAVEATPEVADPALDEAPPAEEAPATPYQGRYATKYQTVEALDEAHRNALEMAQRNAENARNIERQNLELQEYLRLAGEYIEQQQAAAAAPAPTAGQPVDPALAAQAEQLGIDPEILAAAKQLAAQEAESRFAPLAQQFEQQQQQQMLAQTEAATRSQILAFRAAHADLPVETEEGIVNTFREFGLDPTVPDNYDIALEAAENPKLLQILRANPNYIDTDAGMEYAREQASLRLVTQAAPSRTAEVAAARQRAVVESGSGGAAGRIEDERPKDAYDLALEMATTDRKKSAFGV